jgi:hypothetical protein
MLKQAQLKGYPVPTQQTLIPKSGWMFFFLRRIRLDFEAARRVNQHRLGILPGATVSEHQPAQHLSIPQYSALAFHKSELGI